MPADVLNAKRTCQNAPPTCALRGQKRASERRKTAEIATSIRASLHAAPITIKLKDSGRKPLFENKVEMAAQWKHSLLNMPHIAKQTARTVCRKLLDFLFPRRCLVCGSTNPGGKYDYVCPECEGEIHIMRGGHCLICAEIVSMPDAPNVPFCAKCAEHPPAFRRGMAVCVFDGAARELVHELKYRSTPAAVGDIVRIAKEHAEVASYLKDSILVPVPLHRSRQRQRKYNQSELIAKALAKNFPDENVKVCGMLARIRKTGTQTMLDREARTKNIKGAFKCVRRKCEKVPKNARIVLVDDVMTTTATLSECAKELKKAGFKDVYAFAFAKRM